MDEYVGEKCADLYLSADNNFYNFWFDWRPGRSIMVHGNADYDDIHIVSMGTEKARKKAGAMIAGGWEVKNG